MGEAEIQVLARMADNGGVITRCEALAMGMTSSTLNRRVRNGHLVAVGRGVYVLPGVLRDELTLLGAATAALSGVVSHESAARLYELEGLNPRRVSITVPVRRSNRFNGVLVHQSTDLTQDQTTLIRGLLVTNPERTLLDLAAVLGESRLGTVLDQAHRRGLTSYDLVADRLEVMARKGKPGVKKLRRVLEIRLGGNYVSDSTLETLLIKLLDDADLMPPDLQYRPPWLKQTNGRVDLAYPAELVVVEGDSRRWHGTPEAFQADRLRDNLAQAAGWVILRFTWEDITQRPSYVVSLVRTVLSKRSRAQ